MFLVHFYIKVILQLFYLKLNFLIFFFIYFKQVAGSVRNLLQATSIRSTKQIQYFKSSASMRYTYFRKVSRENESFLF